MTSSTSSASTWSFNISTNARATDLRAPSALVLAGGRGARFHGQDKGLIPLLGRPLIDHVLTALAPQADVIFISANRNIAEYEAYGHRVLRDATPGHEGPLAGLLAGLHAAPGDYLLIVPCDAPLLAKDLATRLIHAAREHHALAVLAHDGKQRQPLYGLYATRLAPQLAQYLAAGNRKVQDWVATLNPAVVDFSDQPHSFSNINNPADLADAEHRLRAARMTTEITTPVLGIVGYSGSGKTTLLTRLIPLLRAHGLRIAAIKHTHHDIDMDQPGKDSHRLRSAGAQQTLLASPHRSTLITEYQGGPTEPHLPSLLTQLDHNNLNLILVEGFKHEPIPKIEVHRQGLGHPLLYPTDPHIIALAGDIGHTTQTNTAYFDIDAPDTLATFIRRNILRRA